MNQNNSDLLPALLKISSFCHPLDLIRTIRLLNRHWNYLVNDETLWAKIDFNRYDDLPTATLQNLPVARVVKKLILCGRQDFSIDKVIDFVKNNPQLTELNVERCEWVKDKLIDQLPEATSLHSFNFSHCLNLTSLSITFLACTVSKIKSLNIDGIPWIFCSSVTFILEKHFKHLQVLKLEGDEIFDGDGNFEIIGNCTQLEKLHVSCCQHLTDKSLQSIQNLQNLKSLKLRKGKKFTKEGLLSLFTCKSMSHLVELDFSESTQFVNDCVIQMTKCCGPSLQNLALSWCRDITDPGVISIVDHCKNLEVLDIIGLHEITGTYFIRVPEEMPRLRLLNLQQCNRIIDELIEDVVRKKPDLTVFNYYGEQFVHVKG